MSRTGRLSWFPLDTVMDTKIQLIEAEFGLKGFAVIIKLFQLIYGGEGSYCEFTDEVQLLFSKNNQIGNSLVSELITACVRRGIFDRELYEKHGILTSEAIQKNYAKVANRRVQVDVKGEYLLVSDTVFSKNVNIKWDSVSRNTDSVDSFKQSREEEIRIDKSRVEDSVSVAIFKIYEENIGCVSSIVAEQIMDWLNDVDASLIEYAIIEAVTNNKRSLKYIKAIIENHFKAGRKTRADAEAARPQKQGDKFDKFKQPDVDTMSIEAAAIRKRMEAQGIHAG